MTLFATFTFLSKAYTQLGFGYCQSADRLCISASDCGASVSGFSFLSSAGCFLLGFFPLDLFPLNLWVLVAHPAAVSAGGNGKVYLGMAERGGQPLLVAATCLNSVTWRVDSFWISGGQEMLWGSSSAFALLLEKLLLRYVAAVMCGPLFWLGTQLLGSHWTIPAC